MPTGETKNKNKIIPIHQRKKKKKNKRQRARSESLEWDGSQLEIRGGKKTEKRGKENKYSPARRAQAARGRRARAVLPSAAGNAPAPEEKTGSLHPPRPRIKCQTHKKMVPKGFWGGLKEIGTRNPPPSLGRRRWKGEAGSTPGPNASWGLAMLRRRIPRNPGTSAQPGYENRGLFLEKRWNFEKRRGFFSSALGSPFPGASEGSRDAPQNSTQVKTTFRGGSFPIFFGKRMEFQEAKSVCSLTYGSPPPRELLKGAKTLLETPHKRRTRWKI